MWKESEEIVMFYGDRDNDELLLHSGFVLEAGGGVKDAASATVELKVKGEGSDPLYKVRIMLLKNKGEERSGGFGSSHVACGL